MIVYPRSFKYGNAREAPDLRKQQQKVSEVKESLRVWQSLTSELWDLSISNYYFDTWMWQFKKIPAVISRITEIIEEMKTNEAADVVEAELRKNLDYLKNAREMVSFAEEKVESALRLLWARRKELE